MSSSGAPATTPVPAPGGGNVDETVAPVPETTAAAVPLTRAAEFGGKVSARITSVKAITAKAQGPGEITGPAVAVTLQVTNGSKRALEVDRVTVNLADSHGNPGSPMSSDPASPFSGSIEPGGRATGTYVFSVGADLRSPITLSMSYTTEAPVVLFVGDAQ